MAHSQVSATPENSKVDSLPVVHELEASPIMHYPNATRTIFCHISKSMGKACEAVDANLAATEAMAKPCVLCAGCRGIAMMNKMYCDSLPVARGI